MKKVLEFVGKDGFAPREGDVCEINEHRFSRRRKRRGEVSAGVVGAVNVVNDDLNLAVVVHVGWGETAAVLVVLPVIGGHGRVDGGIPRAGEVVEHG